MSSSANRNNCCICGNARASNNARTCDQAACRFSYQRHLSDRKPTCRCCGRPLTELARARQQTTCDDFECRRSPAPGKNDRDQAVGCRVCGIPLLLRRLERQVCEDRDCAVVDAQWRTRQREADRRQHRLNIEEQAAQLRSEMASQCDVEQPSRYELAVVPHTSVAIGPADPDRIRQFEEHLRGIVHKTVTTPPLPDDDTLDLSNYHDESTADEEPAFHTACRLCRGLCCRLGATHAFLSVTTMRRVFENHPELEPEEVVQTYLDHLPEQSLVNSCVFHGTQGCTLPRDWRADMCNRFLCQDLLAIRRVRNDNPDADFFVVAEEEQIVAAEFVEMPTRQPDS